MPNVSIAMQLSSSVAQYFILHPVHSSAGEVLHQVGHVAVLWVESELTAVLLWCKELPKVFSGEAYCAFVCLLLSHIWHSQDTYTQTKMVVWLYVAHSTNWL